MAVQQVQDAITTSEETSTAIENHIASADDHTMYAKLAGRAGGQTLQGDTASGGDLVLQSTAHATKGKIYLGANSYFDENSDDLYIHDVCYVHNDLDVTDDAWIAGNLYGSSSADGNLDLNSTSDADKGFVNIGGVLYIDEDNARLGIGYATPQTDIHVNGYATFVDGVYGNFTTGKDLNLYSTSHATKGKIYLGANSCYDEANDRLGVLTTSPSSELHVVGDGLLTGDFVIDGYVYGGDDASDDLCALSTSDATKGNVYLNEASACGGAYFPVVAKGGGTAFNIGSDDFTTYPYYFNVVVSGSTSAAGFFNEKNNAAAKGILIRAGLNAPVNDDDVIWITFQDGDGAPATQSTIHYNNAAGGAAIDIPSDVRWKKNVRDTDVVALPVVNGLRMRQWDWKDGRGHHEIGWVAQEVEPVYPGMAHTRDDGTMSVTPAALIPMLTKAIQELSDENMSLEAGLFDAHRRIDELEQKVSELADIESRLSRLESAGKFPRPPWQPELPGWPDCVQAINGELVIDADCEETP
jgi:hypothetical protein